MAITREQALDCFRSDDLIGIGMEADAVRRGLHPERVVTYAIEATVSADAAPETLPPVLHRACRLGATGLVLEDAETPLSLASYQTTLSTIREQHLDLILRGLSAAEVMRLSLQEHLSAREVLVRLASSGLQALAGEGASLLGPSARSARDGGDGDAAAWLNVHRTAHALGLSSTASFTFGRGESFAARVDHLYGLRALQEETGGFLACTPIAFSPRHPEPGHRSLDEATATEYLAMLAITRMVLDNIPHVQASTAQGLKMLQMAVRFGADDVGSALLEEQAIKLAGPSNCATEEELRRLIRDAGFRPYQRDSVFQTLLLV